MESSAASATAAAFASATAAAAAKVSPSVWLQSTVNSTFCTQACSLISCCSLQTESFYASFFLHFPSSSASSSSSTFLLSMLHTFFFQAMRLLLAVEAYLLPARPLTRRCSAKFPSPLLLNLCSLYFPLPMPTLAAAALQNFLFSAYSLSLCSSLACQPCHAV